MGGNSSGSPSCIKHGSNLMCSNDPNVNGEYTLTSSSATYNNTDTITFTITGAHDGITHTNKNLKAGPATFSWTAPAAGNDALTGTAMGMKDGSGRLSNCQWAIKTLSLVSADGGSTPAPTSSVSHVTVSKSLLVTMLGAV